MWKRENVIEILNQAKKIDSKYKKFGASAHKYKLNPPIRASFVHNAEERYGFKLPEDYVWFITEIGDGGTGPDYGITPFAELLAKNKDPHTQRYMEEYRHSLAKPFMPRRMMADEVEDYAIARREVYEENPDRYYIFEQPDANDLCDSDGFYILGTHGCQWDFGLIVAGEKYGQVIDTDHEGAYGFVSGSFKEFYQNWLDEISDAERLRKEIEEWRSLWMSFSLSHLSTVIPIPLSCHTSDKACHQGLIFV